MRIIYFLFLAVGLVAVYFISKIVAERNADEEIEKVEKWRRLPVEDRLSAHTDFTISFIKRDAARTANAVTFCAMMLGSVFLFAAFLQDLSREDRRQVEANRMEIARSCRVDAAFRAQLDADKEDDIRVKQAQRDALADSLAVDIQVELSDVPGFSDMPVSVRRFVVSFFEGNSNQQRTRLAGLDADLASLRAQRTALREFNSEQDCPGTD